MQKHKLLRRMKVWGRCPTHGGNCGVSKEIQTIPKSRFKEKTEIAREILEQLEVRT